ncbi:restriction endonuclease [Pseudomonas rhodesiae]|uniref:restriction endonuclease n=1 Tax=Pseudomonas rhodesiae TaxID=76760 RepID=UPI00209F6EAA|nr:restriction endonuclease [Pseudomonas rhodesiae]MCP1511920.1 restriction system protein [Pseudomonas rhodesiae]MDF9770749.1 restriction system protein [Pseudomonas rhodesiae]
MAKRSGFEKVIRAIARETAKQQRLNESERRAVVRAADRAERQQLRAHAIRERERVRYDRESERAAKQNYLEFREQEVRDGNATILFWIEGLQSILSAALMVDDTVTFDSLRVTDKPPSFTPAKALTTTVAGPSQEFFTSKVAPLPWYLSFIPKFKVQHADKLRAALEQFNASEEECRAQNMQRLEALESARNIYDDGLSALLEKKALRDSEVDAFRYSYYEGDPESIIAYCSMVLEKSDYPEGFPQNFSLAFVPESKQLVVEYELPTSEIIPEVSEYRYVKSKDEVTTKQRKPAEIKSLYSDLVASIALRCIHELYEADQGEFIEVCCFNGYVNTIDPATGLGVQPHLVSVRATRETFTKIDLARVDRSICLKNLGAHVSRSPSEAQPIRPIIEFNMVDKRFVDQQDLASQLSSATNLMDLNPYEFEALVANLFGKMGLESKLTRSSRDGGVDCIAYDPRPILGGKVVIQAKRYKHTVGVSAVRDLYGTMMNEGANKGILVTTSGYGPDAFEFAKDKPIELIEGGGLLFLLQEIGVEARILMPTE